MRNALSVMVGILFVTLTAGCQSKESTSTSTSNEELRLLTDEQQEKLYELAERMEKGQTVTKDILNDKGEVVGTVTSTTTVVFLKPSAGGGRFSVNETCTNNCTGVPINLDPSGSTQDNSCHCNDKCDGCTGAIDAQGCSGSCSKSKTGFGDFGIFIAMENDQQGDRRVASR